MTDFLLLQCVAPMQSWGDSSIFNKRKTRGFPTKSGIIGLIATAMGIERRDTKSLTESGILDTVIDVRIDAQGEVQEDYQIIRYNASINKISNKDYIFDGKFLVALSHKDSSVLDRIEQAVQNPKNFLFLGRKSCPPAVPLYHSRVTGNDVQSVFESIPLLSSVHDVSYYEMVITSSSGEVELNDNPISFDPKNRKFVSRRVTIRSMKKSIESVEDTPEQKFDPMEVVN